MKHSEDKLQNIQENNLNVIETKTSTYRAIVNRADSGIFVFTLFALVQIIQGAQSEFLKLYYMDNTKAKLLVSVMSKLAMHSIDVQATEREVHITITREEMEFIKTLLEGRMRHCEHERDTRNEAFNPDTYISQKLLLLDIREWLLCYSVEIGALIPDEETVSAN